MIVLIEMRNRILELQNQLAITINASSNCRFETEFNSVPQIPNEIATQTRGSGSRGGR
jgi:hypothetical protein